MAATLNKLRLYRYGKLCKQSVDATSVLFSPTHNTSSHEMDLVPVENIWKNRNIINDLTADKHHLNVERLCFYHSSRIGSVKLWDINGARGCLATSAKDCQHVIWACM